MASEPINLAECRAFSARWIRARQLTSEGPELKRPAPVLQFQPEAMDRRPTASGRDPCPRCYIRGDIGCAHQRPCETVSLPPEKRDITGKRITPRFGSRWS